MRKIKFRGKTESGEWVYGDLICGHRNKQNSHYYIRKQTDNILEKDEYFIVIPETVGQLIGLKDENGIEIYENDIITCYYGSRWFDIKLEYISDVFGCRYNIPTYIDSIGKIIGNIHDNPELLTDKTKK